MSEGARASREAAIAEDLGRRTAEAQAREALLRAGEAEAALARYILIKLLHERGALKKNYRFFIFLPSLSYWYSPLSSVDISLDSQYF